MKRYVITLITAGSLMIANAKAGGVLTLNDLSPEEQALFDKGAYAELHEPSRHSGHEIGTIAGVGKGAKEDKTLLLIFGKEE
jgi:hypothetical protein